MLQSPPSWIIYSTICFRGCCPKKYGVILTDSSVQSTIISNWSVFIFQLLVASFKWQLDPIFRIVVFSRIHFIFYKFSLSLVSNWSSYTFYAFKFRMTVWKTQIILQSGCIFPVVSKIKLPSLERPFGICELCFALSEDFTLSLFTFQLFIPAYFWVIIFVCFLIANFDYYS